MAEAPLTTAAGRPSYETADGRFDEVRLREFVINYDGPEDPDYPGCVPIPMTVEQFDNYDGRFEYWSRERGVAFICRDGWLAHDAQIAGYMCCSHVGHRTGFARGLEEGQETGRREALAFMATETLRLRGIPVSKNFDRRLAAATWSPQELLHAAQLSETEADFWARLGGGQPPMGERRCWSG